MMMLYITWKGGNRSVVNDIFELSLNQGFSIMNNSDISLHLSSKRLSCRKMLESDEIHCAIKTSGIFFKLLGEDHAKASLKLIETQIITILTNANAINIDTEITKCI